MEQELVRPEEEGGDIKRPRPRSFYVRRMFIFIVNGLTGGIVFFHRHCSNVVAEPMAASYGIEVSKLSIFSSMFFYTFACLQPFTGIIVDLIEPGFVIGTGSLLSGIGAFVCGISNNLAIGSLGRVISGIGSSQIYISSMKCFSNWFELKDFGLCGGWYGVLASCGSIISQWPLSAYAELVGWRWAYHTIGFVSVFFSICSYIFIRGNPETFGYERVNYDSTPPVPDCKGKCVQLKENVKIVLKNTDFWICALWIIAINGPFFDISGMWGGPFLTNIMGYSSQKSGLSLLGISIASMVFGALLPYVSNCLKTKKWIVFGLNIIGTLILIPFILIPKKLSFWAITIMFAIYSTCSNTLTSLVYPLVREYFPATAAGTSVGFSNAFAFLTASVSQLVSGFIIKSYGIDEKGNYTEKGYQVGLWIFSIVMTALGCLFIFFARDSMVGLQGQPEIEDFSAQNSGNETDEDDSSLNDIETGLPTVI